MPKCPAPLTVLRLGVRRSASYVYRPHSISDLHLSGQALIGDWRRNPKAHPTIGGSMRSSNTPRCKNYQSGSYRSKALMPKAAEIKERRRRRRRRGAATD